MFLKLRDMKAKERILNLMNSKTMKMIKKKQKMYLIS